MSLSRSLSVRMKGEVSTKLLVVSNIKFWALLPLKSSRSKSDELDDERDERREEQCECEVTCTPLTYMRHL